MGLFDKKYCDICGEKIGLLGNRKLEDGNLCKDCAKQLSPWFSDRRRSTVEDIKRQLAYREENRGRASQFRTTRSYGEDCKVLLDEEHRWFTVTRARDLADANPDILDYTALTGCRVDIDESRTEQKREGPDGKEVSYNPPRYEYSYDFEVIISVNNPYFDEMKFRLNNSSVYIEPQNTMQRPMMGQQGMMGQRPMAGRPQSGMAGQRPMMNQPGMNQRPMAGRPQSGMTQRPMMGQMNSVGRMNTMAAGFDPESNREYRKYREMGAEGDGMKAYSCPSCGAELICDASTAATSCPYCGNPTVVPGQFAGTLKPDFVIPFKLSREDAIRELKKHYRGKVLLPKSFSKENHLQEIQGVYVPFWLFSGEAEGNAHYECTRSHKRTEGEYEGIKTEHFDVYRAGTMPFEKVPVDASTKMPDDHMDSIEPYNYDDLKPFSTAYLPGFLADKFDVSADKSRERADVRCLGSLKKALQGTVTGYATCFPRGEHADIQRGKVHYALLPVWLLNTKWQGKDFLFAMNGQTGKFVGDLPVDKGRFWGMFAAIAVPLSVLSSVIVLLMR